MDLLLRPRLPDIVAARALPESITISHTVLTDMTCTAVTDRLYNVRAIRWRTYNFTL